MSWTIQTNRVIFASTFHEISWLFRHRFSHRFFHRLLMKKAPKTEAKSISLSDEKTILFATLSFMLILCWIWLTFDSHLAPFGSLWAPFCSHWAPFCLLLAYFWCPLAHFWCLGLTFGDPGARFSRFWCPLASFSIFRFTTWMGS